MRPKLLLAGAAAAVLGAAAAPAALAHAAYKSSNPADESTVSSPPSQVTAEFTEPLTDASSMQVFDPCGQQVDNGDSNPSGYEMTVTMSGDKAGRYTVQFKAQSALDSHVTSGSFTFTSTGGAPCPGSEPPTGPGGGGGSGGGSGGGGAQDPDPGDGPVAAGDPGSSTGAGPSGGSDVSRSRGGAGGGDGKARPGAPRGRPRAGGSGPVAFQNTGDTAPPEEPAPWDLPVGGVVLALVLCVLIGAAGGRVYAGIVAPSRR
ncbi:MAG TPA: copper resistance CopC family protein [Actinomycetota bacterium]|nr:copper resistance CopC family protein [Actinomycetota bacterium]